MFAFALWDRQDDSLWLVRDGIGIKSLFIRDDGSRLHFASEIKAILADERMPRQIDLPGDRRGHCRSATSRRRERASRASNSFNRASGC